MGTADLTAHAAVPTARTRRRTWPMIAAAAALCYAFVLIFPHYAHIAGPFSRVFSSMLDHLLDGQFDVAPTVVGQEGFARGGRVYAYWGIMPALLRLPVTVLPHWHRLDFTIPYCVVALLWMGAIKVWTVRFVVREHPGIPRHLIRATYLVVGLSGAQLCFLRFSVYQEVCLWAGLFGALFVAAAIVAQHRGLGQRERLVMALAAGAALLTRVSTGMGLLTAFGLLLLVEAIRHRAEWREQLRRSILPIAVVLAALIVTGWVNYQRWGDPLTFADYTYYLYNGKFTDRLARTQAYGLFNAQRIPFGIMYYFFPVWVFHGSDRQLLFEATRMRLIDSAELPPSSFFLTDPLLLLLAVTALASRFRRWSAANLPFAAIVAGLAIPPLLMLTAISMCFRYRIEFYPLIEFLAFSGLAMTAGTGWAARPRLVWTLAVTSVVSSLIVAVACLIGKLGPGHLLIGQGVGRYYLKCLGLI